jgi:hypothetical protein
MIGCTLLLYIRLRHSSQSCTQYRETGDFLSPRRAWSSFGSRENLTQILLEFPGGKSWPWDPIFSELLDLSLVVGRGTCPRWRTHKAILVLVESTHYPKEPLFANSTVCSLIPVTSSVFGSGCWMSKTMMSLDDFGMVPKIIYSPLKRGCAFEHTRRQQNTTRFRQLSINCVPIR